MEAQIIIEVSIMVIVLVIARILFLIHKNTTGHSRKATKKRTKPCKTFICIGSGGHTAEMLELLEKCDFDKYNPRYYIMASSDKTSRIKVENFEKMNKGNPKEWQIIRIPRSRSVHQSLFTSIFTTLFSILYSIPIVTIIRPELILCNGPGTCVPICILAFLLKAAFITDTRIVFVESFCRVKTLSLTGKILIYFADNFIVQWPELKQKVKRAEYIGRLM